MWNTQTTYSWKYPSSHPPLQSALLDNQKIIKSSPQNGKYSLEIQTTCPPHFEQIDFDLWNHVPLQNRHMVFTTGICEEKNFSFVATVDFQLSHPCITNWTVRMSPPQYYENELSRGPCMTEDQSVVVNCWPNRFEIQRPETCPVHDERAAFILQSIVLPVFLTLLVFLVLYLLFAYIIHRCPKTGTRVIRVVEWIDDKATPDIVIPFNRYINVTSQSSSPLGSSSSNVQFLSLKSEPHHGQHSIKSLSDETGSQSLLTEETLLMYTTNYHVASSCASETETPSENSREVF